MPAQSTAELRRIAPDLAPSITKLTVPAYVLDRGGVVRWMNPAAIQHFGDLRGQRSTQIVAPEYANLARHELAAKLLGTAETTEASVVVRCADGRTVPVDISSTQLVDQGTIVGVFGLADPAGNPVAPAGERPVHLTPRQYEVLRPLAAGHSTAALAAELGIEVETVRNHVRGLLRSLRVHTRLQAVLRAHELGLV